MAQRSRSMKSRIHIVLHGAVQGVGFRPFVYRLAARFSLTGWVANTGIGVLIDAEGSKEDIERFRVSLETEKPALASIQSSESWVLDPVGYERFEIRSTREVGKKNVLVLPDIATCPDCVAELFDPGNRRYRYPFINCTNCGPRFSIIRSLPYDRCNTSMDRFSMCVDCREEYENPMDRRFHAQPIACPSCGPHVELWDREGRLIAEGGEAVRLASQLIVAGRIVAVKGIGGFQLLVDAENESAVKELRRRKRRAGKPMAVMFPSLDSIARECIITPCTRRLLRSTEAPIVLLDRTGGASRIADAVAGRDGTLGAMLPYSPLHHLLMSEVGFAVVATSGNISDEPICIDEREALSRLSGIADQFLVHNRPIVRHIDDSVTTEMVGREMLLRRARGYAPLPIQSMRPAERPLLAIGGHQKNTIAIAQDENVFLSQHIGDLGTTEANRALGQTVSDFLHLFDQRPEGVATDLHPDYISTKFAGGLELPCFPVQHHFAHVVSCMAENRVEGDVLGVAWDGSGLGPDGTIWGGEFLDASPSGFKRVASLRPFQLPGGETAIREPRRSAAGVLYELGNRELLVRHLQQTFNDRERRFLAPMLRKGLNATVTTSAGRLFDAVASLIGLRQVASFEGEAAMEVENVAEEWTSREYPYRIEKGEELFVVDWGPMILGILDDHSRGARIGQISAGFHMTLARMIVDVARRIGRTNLVLTGGCFQNRKLTESAVCLLRKAGFRPYWHQRVPPNDGGIALGQLVHAGLGLRQPVLHEVKTPEFASSEMTEESVA